MRNANHVVVTDVWATASGAAVTADSAGSFQNSVVLANPWGGRRSSNCRAPSTDSVSGSSIANSGACSGSRVFTLIFDASALGRVQIHGRSFAYTAAVTPLTARSSLGSTISVLAGR